VSIQQKIEIYSSSRMAEYTCKATRIKLKVKGRVGGVEEKYFVNRAKAMRTLFEVVFLFLSNILLNAVPALFVHYSFYPRPPPPSRPPYRCPTLLLSGRQIMPTRREVIIPGPGEIT
jgi:hypothetical protein